MADRIVRVNDDTLCSRRDENNKFYGGHKSDAI